MNSFLTTLKKETREMLNMLVACVPPQVSMHLLKEDGGHYM